MVIKLYKVTYWQEGPGRSDYHSVMVLAPSKKEAISFVNKKMYVYRAELDLTWASLIKNKCKAFIVEDR